MNITFFNQKLDIEYFFNNFFKKSIILWENWEKLFLGTFDDFLRKEASCPKN